MAVLCSRQFAIGNQIPHPVATETSRERRGAEGGGGDGVQNERRMVGVCATGGAGRGREESPMCCSEQHRGGRASRHLQAVPSSQCTCCTT